MNLDYYKDKLRNALYEYVDTAAEVDPEMSNNMTQEEPVKSNKKQNNVNDLSHIHPGGQSPMRDGMPRLAAPTKSLISPHIFLQPKPIQKSK